jgi:hypothetical protein
MPIRRSRVVANGTREHERRCEKDSLAFHSFNGQLTTKKRCTRWYLKQADSSSSCTYRDERELLSFAMLVVVDSLVTFDFVSLHFILHKFCNFVGKAECSSHGA